MNSINIGDQVRSFDFESRDDCFIEGTVRMIGDCHTFVAFDGCPRYKIEVSRVVRGGKEIEPTREFIYPPINGLETTFGGVTSGVKKIYRPDMAVGT